MVKALACWGLTLRVVCAGGSDSLEAIVSWNGMELMGYWRKI
jgi:hypothetical protein